MDKGVQRNETGNTDTQRYQCGILLFQNVGGKMSTALGQLANRRWVVTNPFDFIPGVNGSLVCRRVYLPNFIILIY